MSADQSQPANEARAAGASTSLVAQNFRDMSYDFLSRLHTCLTTTAAATSDF